MFALKLDEITEEGLNLKWQEDRASLANYLENFSKIDFDFESPLRVEVKILKAGRSIFIKGGVQTALHLQCARCLKEFPFPLSSNFDLTLHPVKGTYFTEEVELKGEEMESNFFEGEEINLSEIAFEQILLEIPYQPLCHEGCRGLCSVCGKDLNLSDCGCLRENFGSYFSTLQKLKFN